MKGSATFLEPKAAGEVTAQLESRGGERILSSAEDTHAILARELERVRFGLTRFINGAGG